EGELAGEPVLQCGVHLVVIAALVSGGGRCTPYAQPAASRVVSRLYPPVNPQQSAAERLRVDDLHRQRRFQVLEEREPAADGDGMDDQSVLVDQLVSGEFLRERSSTVCHQVVPGLLLEPGNFVSEVATGDLRIRPV